MTVYSSRAELESIAHYLTAYMKIPYFQDDAIPGQIMEKIISLVRGASQLATYDYVDVVREGQYGWSVKSTKEDTPLTWKRAKIENSDALIKASEIDANGLKVLGDAIIDFCNKHAEESIEKYHLDEIGYARLIMFQDGTAVYFEKLLCTKQSPIIFNKNDYSWNWSVQKQTKKKEQLSALHGTNIRSGKKAFAWHGRGENQLHFSGEGDWWPTVSKPSIDGQINFSADGHAMAFKLPESKVDWDALVNFLNEES